MYCSGLPRLTVPHLVSMQSCKQKCLPAFIVTATAAHAQCMHCVASKLMSAVGAGS